MTFATWIERVEDAVADEAGLQALADQIETDADLTDRERETALGRCETYLENFDDVRQARLLSAVDATGGAPVEDGIPDFDLAYDFDRTDARIDEAAFEERLHPRNRIGKWVQKLRSSKVKPLLSSEALLALEQAGEKLANANISAEDMVNIVTNLQTVFQALQGLVASADVDYSADLQEAIEEARAFDVLHHPRDRLGRWRDAPFYHGTNAQFPKFDVSRTGSMQTSDWGEGVYLTPSRAQADRYREDAVVQSNAEVTAAFEEHERLTKDTPVVNGAPQYSEESREALKRFQEIARRVREDDSVGRVMEVRISPDAKIATHYIEPGSITDPYLAQTMKDKGFDAVAIYDRIRDEGDRLSEIVVMNPAMLIHEAAVTEGYRTAAQIAQPRDRLGKWRDIPAVPRKQGDLLAGKSMHRMYDGFSFNGITAAVMGGGMDQGTREVYGVLLHDPDDSGEPITVGTFEHSAFRDSDGLLVIQRTVIQIWPDFRDRGFATAFYAHEEREAHAYGVDRIELSASLETGGYTWARAGFEFDTDPGADQALDRARAVSALWSAHGWGRDEKGEPLPVEMLEPEVGEKRAPKVIALRDRVGQEAWDAFAAKFPWYMDLEEGVVPEGTFSYEHEIAMYGRDGERWEEDGHEVWLGKAFLLGAGWEGVKRLYPEVHGNLKAPVEEGEYEAPAPCQVVARVYQGWRAARRVHDAPDDISGDDDDGFWDAVKAALA